MTSQPELMTETEFTKQMVAKYRGMLLSAAGLSSVTLDGQVVSYQDLQSQYSYWKGKLAQLEGGASRLQTIDLSTAF
jgi:hypothetical protein